jgi:hypothetical protein
VFLHLSARTLDAFGGGEGTITNHFEQVEASDALKVDTLFQSLVTPD